MKRAVGVTVAILVVLLLGLALLKQWRHGSGARIGVLTYVDHPILNAIVDNFRSEMATLGYRDGETARFYYQNAQGVNTDIEPLARSLLRNRLDVFVPVSTPVSRVVFNVAPAGQTVVYTFVTNPDDLEPALSERNGTGVSDRINYRKSMHLIKELFPSARSVGILFNPAERNSEVALSELRSVAPTLGLELRVEAISSSGEIRDAARRLVPHVEVMFIGPDNTVVGSAPMVVQVAEDGGKPVIAVDSGTVDQGALAAYSVDYASVGRETAHLVDRVLRSPSSVHERMVPIYNDDLVVNLCAAKRLAYAFPPEVLARAIKVIRCE